MKKKILLVLLIIVLVVYFIIPSAKAVTTGLAEKKEVSDKLSDYIESETVEIPKPPKEEPMVTGEGVMDKPSDVEGMTKREKAEKGMFTKDGADSDGDGLTDKEEIEIYHTDPTKMSTAGDLMTDGEKVKKGLDPLKKVLSKPKDNYPKNETNAVKLTAERPEDYGAVVYNETDAVALKNRVTLKAYSVSGYSGKLNISVKELCEKNGLKPSDIAVYVGESFSGSAKNVSVSVKGTKLVLKKSLDGAKDYDVYLVKKKLVNGREKVIYPAIEDLKAENTKDVYKKAGIRLEADAGQTNPFDLPLGNLMRSAEPEGFIEGSPLGSVVGFKFHIYYKKLTSDQATWIERDNLIKSANQICATWSRISGEGDIKIYTHELTGGEIRSELAVRRTAFPMFEWKMDEYSDMNVCCLFHCYMSYDQGEKMSATENASNPVNAVYDPIPDELLNPKAEYSTKKSGEIIDCGFTDKNVFLIANPVMEKDHELGYESHGICLGMAYGMMHCFNTNERILSDEAKGTYKSTRAEKDCTYTWDFTDCHDSRDNTAEIIRLSVYDPALRPVYVSKPFDTKALPHDKQQIINFLHAAWAIGNDNASQNFDDYAIKGYRRPNVSIVKEMAERLGKRQCVSLGINGPDLNHAINITRMVTIKKDSVWVFTGYDNNYPYAFDGLVGNVGLYIKRSAGGNSSRDDTIEYYYGPIGLSDEVLTDLKDRRGIEFDETNTSDYKKGDLYGLSLLDDGFNWYYATPDGTEE